MEQASAMNNVELRWMMTLSVVAQAGSFTAAAAQLHLTQSAVSQQIAALERWTGMQLLKRRPVELTEAGRLVMLHYGYLSSYIGRLSMELGQLREGSAGALHVGAFLSTCRTFIPRAFAAFNVRYPNVILRVSQLEPGPALAALGRGELDIAITFSYGELSVDPPLEAVVICDEPVLLAVPAQHRWATRASVDLAEIDRSELIPASDAFVYPPGPDTGGFRYIGDDFLVLLAFVAAGRGIALVPGLPAKLAPPEVVLRRLSGRSVPRRRIAAITLPDRNQRASTVDLIEELRRAGAASVDEHLAE
jgi:DNA-binding transcriptional LysR family regulator